MTELRPWTMTSLTSSDGKEDSRKAIDASRGEPKAGGPSKRASRGEASKKALDELEQGHYPMDRGEDEDGRRDRPTTFVRFQESGPKQEGQAAASPIVDGHGREGQTCCPFGGSFPSCV